MFHVKHQRGPKMIGVGIYYKPTGTYGAPPRLAGTLHSLLRAGMVRDGHNSMNLIA
jgi:hypothetical protein